MRSAQPELSERETARRLLRIYELNGWALPSLETQKEHQPPTCKQAADARNAQRQS
jgi:hypothetical protein